MVHLKPTLHRSSMHCLTVPVRVEDDAYVKLYTQKKWGQPDGSIKVDVILNEDRLDDDSFAIRRYIPHYSINDKLMYAFASIVQHYWNYLNPAPYKPYKYKWEEDDSGLQKRMEKYNQEYTEWEKKSVHDSNKLLLEKFEEKIHDLEESLASEIRNILFGEGPKNYYFENGIFHDIEKEKVPEDTRPKVTVNFHYKIEGENILLDNGDDDWFTTGCYGNEEFYHTVCYHTWDLTSWILNPYAAILAGSDEQSEEDCISQKKEAKRLLESAWEKHLAESDEEENILPEGKAIWPIGG